MGDFEPTSAVAWAGIASCCQQMSTTPSRAAAAAATSGSCPLEKRVSTSTPIFAASGATVCSGRRLLLPILPADVLVVLRVRTRR